MNGCLPNEYQCGETCIDLVRRCDTHPDCPDAADEVNCETYACPVSYFKCNNHYCVPSEHVCDFYDHCGDASDELECRVRMCEVGSSLSCTVASQDRNHDRCISPSYICDGRNDCHNGGYLSDEYGC
ncbi:G-protein coupled receptor GRL101-like 4, partial [Homarus americanus]